MEKFQRLTAKVVPLNRANVDTDAIIPKQFLKSIKRTGFGPHLFDGWRYLDEGELGMDPHARRVNPDFVLNKPEYQGAQIMLTGENFGCGSSREHAPWALLDYGIRVLIAPSFADIFYNNCFKNGLLPIVLEHDIVADLMAKAEAAQIQELSVDLPNQTVQTAQGLTYTFNIDPHQKHCLLNGLDDIGQTLQHVDAIKAYEDRRRLQVPWLFPDF